jgi:hypothetical protein
MAEEHHNHHHHQEDNNVDNENNDDDDEEYTPLSDSEYEKLYHNAMSFSPLGMRLWSPPAHCELYWATWASLPPLSS